MNKVINNIPFDINAETLLNYLPEEDREVNICGTHKRNAYEDILEVSYEDNVLRIDLARDGLYDILPEALFHPIDRFQNIPANEYKERFADECSLQQKEEDDARKFFAPFDRFIIAQECEVAKIKEVCLSDNSFLSSILTDSIDERLKNNRFVKKLIPFVPLCSKMKGNRELIAIMLRKILKEEEFVLKEVVKPMRFRDENPQYNCRLEQGSEGSESLDCYLGNEYIEDVIEYEISYWNEEECNESFMNFISEMEILEEFINDYFSGIESPVKFRIEKISLPVRLSDANYYNYLEYNTNL